MYELVAEFLEKSLRVETISKLEQLLEPILHHYEIQHYICTSMYGFDYLPGRKPMFGKWDTGWVSHFLSNGYYLEDAIVFNMMGIEGDGKPYYWTELVAEKELTKTQYNIFAEAWDADLREGLVIPIVVSDTELALVSMGGKNFKQDMMVKGILWSVSIQAHRRARQIIIRDYEANNPFHRVAYDEAVDIEALTGAEVNTIVMLANDLRAPEIAEATNRSVNTVRKHMATAKKKLKVDNTEGLVAQAIRYRIIT